MPKIRLAHKAFVKRFGIKFETSGAVSIFEASFSSYLEIRTNPFPLFFFPISF
jgi:hypothetical protein